MNDMTALERLIADVAAEAAGPPRPVDAMAMVRAATTRSPKWRFQPMFSATKFVVAGVIVALFGGFLLSGVLSEPTLGPGAATALTHVVAQDGNGDFRTITEAVETAEDGDTILVGPGTYTEASIVVSKDITIIGDGEREEVVIEATDSPAFLLDDTDATLSTMTLRGELSRVLVRAGAPVLIDLVFDEVGQTTPEKVGPESEALLIREASEAVVRGSSFQASPIKVGVGASPTFADNQIVVPTGIGILIWLSPTSATIVDNVIKANTGILVVGADVVARDNTIIADTGISLIDADGAIFEDNELFDNEVAIKVTRSDSLIAHNDLRDNSVGIVVVSGSPTLDGNAISAGRTGLSLWGRSATPVLSGNVICDNETNLDVQAGAQMPDIDDNEICPDASARSVVQ
jgi:hypothetical protein